MTIDLQLVGTRKAAEILGMHPITVQRLAREGRLPSIRVGGRWKFELHELREWLDKRRTRGQATLRGT